jgi:hypothetical protein
VIGERLLERRQEVLRLDLAEGRRFERGLPGDEERIRHAIRFRSGVAIAA